MRKLLTLFSLALLPVFTFASEANLVIPPGIKDQTILYWGFLITFAGFMFGLYQFLQVKKIKAHKSMLDVAQVIFETAKTYLVQQGKFLMILFLFIGSAVAFLLWLAFGCSFRLRRGIDDPGLDCGWNFRFLQRCLVRNQDEHTGQLEDGFCLTRT